MKSLKWVLKKALGMGDALALMVIVSAGVSVAYALARLSETHAFSLFAYLYSTFALVLLIYKMGQWLHRLSAWLRRHSKRYAAYRERYEQSLALKSRSTKAVYIGLRVLTIACAVAMFLLGEYQNFMLCLLTLVLFTLPDALRRNLSIRLPSTLETIVYCFIFAAEVLGEINNFYGLIPGWDTMLHTLNGFLCAAIGFSLVDMLNRNSKNISLSPFYVALSAFCFSRTVGVLWEFIEFFGDLLFFVDMQKDTLVPAVKSILINPTGQNVPLLLEHIEETVVRMQGGETFVITGGYLDVGLSDTMKDLFVNFVGAVTFSAFGYFYIKKRDENAFVTRFIPVVERQEAADSAQNP